MEKTEGSPCLPTQQPTPKQGYSIRKELVLDTKGTCFACLSEDVDGLTETCLRNICRFLNVNPCSIVLESLKGGFLDNQEKDEAYLSSQREACDFAVMLCTNCSALVENLGELFIQMEMIKMLTTHQLRIFNQILRASEQEPESHSLWKKFQQKIMSSGEDPVEARILETLRHETKEKCTKKLHLLTAASHPKVLINPVMSCTKNGSHNKIKDSNSIVRGGLKILRKISKTIPPRRNILQLKSETRNAMKVSPRGISQSSKNHLRQSRNTSRQLKWVCSVASGGCGQKFAGSGSLPRHKKEYCPNRKTRMVWTCNPAAGGCGQKVSSKESLIRHKRYWCYANQNRRRWTCDVESGGCGKSLRSRCNLMRHQRYNCSGNRSRMDMRNVE